MSLKRAFIYSPPDAVGFWRARASQEGWLSVMWQNPAYNELAHRDQWKAIEQNLPQAKGSVLDLGCGTGRLSKTLAGLFSEYTGVDLDTMASEARRRNPELSDCFFAATVQEYNFPTERFDLILSMACLASACTADELPDTLDRIVGAAKPGGHIVLIDPFHRVPTLTRTCRISARKVINMIEARGTKLLHWSGIHFVPVRLVFARPFFSSFPGLTRTMYRSGELLGSIAPRYFNDYQIIAVRKN